MKIRISRPLAFTLSFALVALAWRLIFLPVSQGSYTDGVLQMDSVRWGLTYWPPLFSVATRLVALLPGLGLEGAARLIALIAGVAVIFPLSALARRLFGLRAALWAMAAWLASPSALRWSLQGMTDMPLTALWLGALAALLIGVEFLLPGLFPQDGPPPTPEPRRAGQWLLVASLLGVLATLTRYQGIFLLPVFAVIIWKLAPVARRMPVRTRGLWLTLLPWLAAPVWLLRQGTAPLATHMQQIGERTAGGLGATFIHVYGYMFEHFLLASPYFVTYGLFLFFLYGLFRTNWSTARLRWTGWTCLYLGLVILAIQSVFAAFQSRYLLPLVPLVCLFAGHGLATWERHSESRPWRFWALAAPALLWGLTFSALVAVYQGNPFKDIKEASLLVRSMNLPPTRVVASNEIYNAKIGAAKVSFWSGREVKPLGSVPAAPGDVIVYSSVYAGGLERYRAGLQELTTTLPARVVGRFAYYAYPLLPDIMQEPGTHPTPRAFDLRYQRQYFQTAVLEVTEAPREDSKLDQMERELRDMKQELDKLKK